MKTPVKVYVGAEFIAEGYIEDEPEMFDTIHIDDKDYFVKAMIPKNGFLVLFCKRVLKERKVS